MPPDLFENKSNDRRRRTPDVKRRVLVLTPIKPRRRHDKNLLDRVELVANIPPEIGVVVDTSFEGIKHPNRFMPQKATKKRPLSEEEREVNRYINAQCIVVEQAIGGMKRYGAMSQVLRYKIGRFDDRVALICAGLWNLHLASQVAMQS